MSQVFSRLATLVVSSTIAVGTVIVSTAPVSAQGNTGGSLGKTDQELSGGTPKQAPVQRGPKRGSTSEGQSRPKNAAAGLKTFHNPTLNGRRVNWCLYNSLNQSCGEQAATAWCRSKGLSRATDFKWEVQTSAISLGDRGICSNFCGVFTVVACE